MASERDASGAEVDYFMVLILVLVEDGFRARYQNQRRSQKNVLILVLVEDGFRGQKMQSDDH